ncbi:MAG: SGNH/GDSL hydrolase family protein [Planctomycetes bacterium]|nr:SGNH/GDSL hydrolase family protein [Planctomycetota bacterium]
MSNFARAHAACSYLRRFGLAVLCAALALAAAARAEDDLPAAWKTWADRAYTTRYLLQLFTPPAEGATGLQPENNLATLVLPLKTTPLLSIQGDTPKDPDAPTTRPEDVLLLDEEGRVVPILIREVKGGNEVQIAFPFQKGQQRFCLYAGAAAGNEVKHSPQTFAPKALRVRVHALELSQANTPTEKKPLTLERFKAIPLDENLLLQDIRKNIDDPEPLAPPFVDDPERRLPRLKNIERYAALYEGFLRAPLKGSYAFCVTTFGAAFLVIDGEAVASSGAPDPGRGAFALAGKKGLAPGIHRVALYFAQGGMKTGVRLQWKAPGEPDFTTVPAQAFVRGIPAEVAGVESRGAVADDPPVKNAFVHLEQLGQCRTGLFHGPAEAREWVQLFAQAVGPLAGEGRVIRLSAAGAAPVDLPSTGGLAWLPAGVEVAAELFNRDGSALPSSVARKVIFPTEEAGARDVDLLPGELALKFAPQFIYPDETGQLHFEAQLNPLPQLTSKERVERGLLRQAPLPPGQFRMRMRVTGMEAGDAAQAGKALAGDAEIEATPDESGRRKIRIPIEGAKLAEFAKSGSARLEIELLVGGVRVDRLVFRLLHSRAEWPGELVARPDHLEFIPAKGNEKERDAERVLVLAPREDEGDYRRFQPLGLRGAPGAGVKEALFAGDPLVEAPEGKADAAIGLAARMPKVLPDAAWTALSLPGPYRGRFVYRLLAGVETRLRALPNGKRIELAVVALGGGDASGQTPMHDFERGLDVIIDRLRRAGIQNIVLLGVVPEPGHVEQGAAYREHLADLARQHHIDVLDLYTLWTREKDGTESKEWVKRFALDPEGKSPVYGPVPNADALGEIVDLLKAKLK